MNGNNQMTRREMMSASVASAGLAALSSTEVIAADESKWIDAHSHIWPPETDKFPLAGNQTKKDLNPPSFTDDELMALARPEGVERVVLIQHSTYHRFDNSCILDAVKRHPQRFRAVGMLDDTQSGTGAAMKKLLAQGVTGFRITPSMHKANNEQWLETPGMIEMWKTGAETRQSMCCLINPNNLPGVDKMCERHPETPVVIDHFSRIGVDGEIRDADVANLCKLARHKHTAVKISAYYALGKKQPPHLELVPMIKRLFDAFGRERLMWASDCPYQVQGVNNYAASISLVRDKIDFFTPEDRQWLLRKTAEKVFFFM